MFFAVNDQGDGTNFQVLTLSTKDIIYDLSRQKIYASVPSSVGAAGNSIISIDPVAGTVGSPSSAVGTDPGKLAISDNDQYLYVALDGEPAVRRFDIASQTPGLKFSLGTDAFGGIFSAEDIAVLPGSPGSVAISRMQRGSSPRHRGVAIYDDGVARTAQTPEGSGSNVIEFSATPSRLYGLNNETTEAGFRRMTVDNSGVTILDSTPNLASGPDIKFDGGRIFSSGGTIIDPEARTQLGTFPLPFNSDQIVAFCPDSASGRVFFLIRIPFVISLVNAHWRLLAFDSNTFAQVGSIDVPGDATTATASSLIRWGAHGLAFRTSENQVILITTDLIP